MPNAKGRVLSSKNKDEAVVEKGLYVCGWLKRGPTGIIATNLYCAEETVSQHSNLLRIKCIVSVEIQLKDHVISSCLV